jgi:Uma2 family endonuclease
VHLQGRRPITYADIEALPANKVGEILADELVVMPRPGPAHASACVSLLGELFGPYGRGRGGPGGWRILMEPELHLRRDVIVPDIAGWRLERLPELPETAFFELVPDWVCEIVSPSTATYDRVAKRRIYAREGVLFYWMVDPIAQTVETLRLEDGRWVDGGSWSEDSKAAIAPFEAIELDLALLWPKAATKTEDSREAKK